MLRRILNIEVSPVLLVVPLPFRSSTAAGARSQTQKMRDYSPSRCYKLTDLCFSCWEVKISSLRSKASRTIFVGVFWRSTQTRRQAFSSSCLLWDIEGFLGLFYTRRYYPTLLTDFQFNTMGQGYRYTIYTAVTSFRLSPMSDQWNTTFTKLASTLS